MKTLRDIQNEEPNSYISGGLIATVSDPRTAQTKTGKTFFKAKLEGDGISAYATSFSTSLAQFDGQTVAFTGMGIKKGEDYNGTMQISFGDKTKMAVYKGDTPASAPEPRKSQGNAVSAPSGGPAGVTVGMAINKAVDIAIAEGNWGIHNIEGIARSLIDLSARLQSGAAPEKSTENVPF